MTTAAIKAASKRFASTRKSECGKKAVSEVREVYGRVMIRSCKREYTMRVDMIATAHRDAWNASRLVKERTGRRFESGREEASSDFAGGGSGVCGGGGWWAGS